MQLSKLFYILFIVVFVIGLSEGYGQISTKVTNVLRPDLKGQNRWYIGNRAPLQPANFIKLPLGSVQPKGWILKMLELQKDGLSGHLGEISAWLDKKDNAWLTVGGEHGWEEVPYWLRGYSDMAFIFDDAQMKKEAMVWIEAILKSQKESGWFGPEVRSRDTKQLDYWPNMLVLFTLQNYYEYTGDQRILNFMEKYFQFELKVPKNELLTSYWEKSRGGDNLYSIYWLYNITGKNWLLELADKIHSCTANWMQQSNLPNWHNVNICLLYTSPSPRD